MPIAQPSPGRPLPVPVPAESVWRFSVEQYDAMIRAGILQEGDPVELLDGRLVTKMTKHPPHVLAAGSLLDQLARMLPPGWHVRKEDPVAALDSVPEPDLAVVRGGRRDYASRHPDAKDAALVVEVAESSLDLDREVKKPIYARSGFRVYWIVNIPGRMVEVYADPAGPGESPDYLRRDDFGEGESVPVVLDGREVGRVEVRELLP